MISYELAQRITPTECLVLSCDPGTVNTKMLLAGWGSCGMEIANANDEFTLATNPFLETEHGKYYVNCRESSCSRDVYNNEKRKSLWNELERICDVNWNEYV